MLTNRLRACADLVRPNKRVGDIGTDHAYLIADLLKSGTCSFAVAADIGEGPLRSAKRTLEQEGVLSKVQLILSDGLAQIPADTVDDVVIAGMGGETIVHILENCPYRQQLHLILQPQSKKAVLRQWLAENGFFGWNERTVQEDKFYYQVLDVYYTGKNGTLSDAELELGQQDMTQEEARNYFRWMLEKCNEILSQLKGKGLDKAAYWQEVRNMIQEKLGEQSLTVGQVYDAIQSFAPFSTQEKWDNSGLLVGGRNQKVTKILTTLDISKEAIAKAEKLGANLIVAHHPVIFSPIKNVAPDSPVYQLIQKGIAAICVHTPMDIAPLGINLGTLKFLQETLGFSQDYTILEPNIGELGFGWVCDLKQSIDAKAFAEKLRVVFGISSVRYSSGFSGEIHRVGFCSGSGASMLEEAVALGCDAYITGDIKHDRWYAAEFFNLCLFDCSHYGTEKIVAEQFAEELKKQLPQVEILHDCGKDPAAVIFGGEQ